MDADLKCHACHSYLLCPPDGPGPVPAFCDFCRDKYPASLLKASYDVFQYALRVRTGEVFVFENVVINGEWVRLQGVENTEYVAVKIGEVAEDDMRFDRDVDVRVADIVWCADAPWGY